MNQKIKTLFCIFSLLILAVIVFVLWSQTQNRKAEPVAKNFHAAMYYFDNKDFFPESVETFKNINPISPAPRLFIVNQHILAAHLIAKQFALAADPKVKTVVLITQNNWNAGHSPIITSVYDWQTSLGNIAPANGLARKLVNQKLAFAEEEIFTREHGITGIVPYVVHFFPNVAILPLVIRDKTANESVDALAKELSKLDLSTTAIIASIDMSHYLPKYIADAHDRLTVQSIKAFDYETLPRLDIDTMPTLRTIMKVAENHNQKNFVQTDGVNSAEIVGDPNLLSTTSYVTGYFTPEAGEKPSESVHMLFVGDIMLDRAIAKHAEKNGADSLFSKLERLFLGTHLVIGNLEGTMTDKPSVSQADFSILHFTFDPTFAKLLKKFNFSAFSLANNHTLDFGGDGYTQTINNLHDVGLFSFGSPRNDVDISTAVAIQGKILCLVGYHDLFIPNSAPAIEEIKKIRPDCNYIVLFAHWGVEYLAEPTERQIKLAHDFIDAGADLVIGAHPHVVQPVEIYKNKAIFYSLGNFMFDQQISFATEHGLAVNVEWDDEKTVFTLVPTTIENYEVGIANPADGARVLTRLVTKNLLSPDLGSVILKDNQITLWNNQINQ